MLTTKSKTKIIGVTLGKAMLNVVHAGIPPITAEFGLVREDGELCGLFEKRMEWSEKTMKAYADLQAAMEQDAMEALFEMPPPGAVPGEPPQV